MQPSLPIEVLARKPQIVLNRSHINISLAKGQVVGRPDDGHGLVGHTLGGAQVVVVVIIDGSVRGDLGQGLAVQPDVGLEHGAGCIGFSDELAGLIVMKYFGGAVGLFHALAGRIVNVVGRVGDRRGGVGRPQGSGGCIAVVIVLDQFGMGASDGVQAVCARIVGVAVLGRIGAGTGAGQSVAHGVIGVGHGAENTGGTGQTVQVIVGKPLAAGGIQVVGDGRDVAHIVLGVGAVHDRAAVGIEQILELVVQVKAFTHGHVVAKDHVACRAERLVGDTGRQDVVAARRVEHHGGDLGRIHGVSLIGDGLAGGIDNGAQIAGIIVPVTGDIDNAVDGPGLGNQVAQGIVAVLDGAGRIGDRGQTTQQIVAYAGVIGQGHVLGRIAVHDVGEPAQDVVLVLNTVSVLHLVAQIAVFIVTVPGGAGVRRMGAYQTAQVIIGVGGDIARTVGDRGQAAVQVVGISGCHRPGLSHPGQAVEQIVLVGGLVGVGIGHIGQVARGVIAIGGFQQAGALGIIMQALVWLSGADGRAVVRAPEVGHQVASGVDRFFDAAALVVVVVKQVIAAGIGDLFQKAFGAVGVAQGPAERIGGAGKLSGGGIGSACGDAVAGGGKLPVAAVVGDGGHNTVDVGNRSNIACGVIGVRGGAHQGAGFGQAVSGDRIVGVGDQVLVAGQGGRRFR